MKSEELNHYVKRWGLEWLSSHHETKTGFVAQVLWEGKPCVLKVSLDDGDEQTASVLRQYNGHGAVRVYAEHDRAVLLEKAVPGTHLSSLVVNGEDERATEIICDVIEKLHESKMLSGDYKFIADLRISFSRYLNSGSSLIPKVMVQKANEIYEALLSTQTEAILLHGDLHHDNIIYDNERGWLAIDPKGYIGEPSYEMGAMLRNPHIYTQLFTDTAILDHRIQILMERLGFEKERILGWAFSQAVLASLWCIEDSESPESFLSVAKILEKMIEG